MTTYVRRLRIRGVPTAQIPCHAVALYVARKTLQSVAVRFRAPSSRERRRELRRVWIREYANASTRRGDLTTDPLTFFFLFFYRVNRIRTGLYSFYSPLSPHAFRCPRFDLPGSPGWRRSSALINFAGQSSRVIARHFDAVTPRSDWHLFSRVARVLLSRVRRTSRQCAHREIEVISATVRFYRETRSSSPDEYQWSTSVDPWRVMFHVFPTSSNVFTYFRRARTSDRRKDVERRATNAWYSVDSRAQKRGAQPTDAIPVDWRTTTTTTTTMMMMTMTVTARTTTAAVALAHTYTH